MKFKQNLLSTLVLCALSATSFVVSAQTLRVANQGDALSMDPHSLSESLQFSVTGNVYEGLVLRNKDLSLAPGLATSTDGGPLRPQLDVSKKMSGDMALRPCCSGFVGAAGRASNRSARTFRLARADRQHRHARGAHDIRSVTLPKKARATLRRPCVAITMRSAWSSSAVFRISSRGSPLATMSRRRSIASSPGR